MMEKEEDILEITPAAVDKIYELIESRDRGELAVRVVVRGALPGGKYQSEFKFIPLEEQEDDDFVQDTGKFKLLVSESAAELIIGARVDFDENRYAAGFNIEYPEQENPGKIRRRDDWTDPIAIAAQKVIDEHVNPGIDAHGGWVVMDDFKDGIIYMEMGGGCQGCSLSAVTLREGIEQMILTQVPGVTGIVDTTNHDLGESPYYSEEGESALS